MDHKKVRYLLIYHMISVLHPRYCTTSNLPSYTTPFEYVLGDFETSLSYAVLSIKIPNTIAVSSAQRTNSP